MSDYNISIIIGTISYVKRFANHSINMAGLNGLAAPALFFGSYL